jgi:hypothetical protein
VRFFAIVLLTVLMACGCSKQPTVHPGVQINDLPMYISEKPIIPGDPVTFWFKMNSSSKKALKEAVDYRFGCPGLKINEVDQSTVEVTDAKVTRKVAVKQGGKILYQHEDTVTPDNMVELSSWTINSEKWADVQLTSQDIEFGVDYWRSYKSTNGIGGHAVMWNCVKIPVAK